MNVHTLTQNDKWQIFCGFFSMQDFVLCVCVCQKLEELESW